MTKNPITEENYEKVVELIADSLCDTFNNQEELQYGDVMQAALDIAQLLSGASIFINVTFKVWCITHPKLIKDIRKRARENGIDVTDQLIEDLIRKIYDFLGLKYPPCEEIKNQ